MKILIYLAIITTVILSSCAKSKDLKDKNGKITTYEPYGWANENSKKCDTVVYEINIGNVVISILTAQTLIVPAVLTGAEFYEPIRYAKQNESAPGNDYKGILAIIFCCVIFYDLRLYRK